MHVEVRGAIENAVAHHPSPLWIGLRCGYLKLRAVVLHRNIGGEAVAWGQTVSPHQRGCATTKHIAAGPTGTCGMPSNHDAGILPLGASGRSPAKTLSMIRRRARVHERRLAWRFGWRRSGDRSVLGCAVRASGGVAEPQRARV